MPGRAPTFAPPPKRETSLVLYRCAACRSGWVPREQTVVARDGELKGERVCRPCYQRLYGEPS